MSSTQRAKASSASSPTFSDTDGSDEPLPERGYITLPHDKPGFGLTLNKKALNLHRPYSHTVAKPLRAAPAPEKEGADACVRRSKL